MAISTSIRCVRSFAASLAWVQLILCIISVQTYFYWTKEYSFGSSLNDIFTLLCIQSLFILLSACSNSFLTLSIAYHALFVIFCVVKYFVKDSVTLPFTSVRYDTIVVVTGCISLTHCFVIGQAYKCMSMKNKMNSRNNKEVNLSTPLVSNHIQKTSPKETKVRDVNVMLDDDEDTNDPYVKDLPEITTNNFCSMACLPVRVGFYLVFMVLMLPLGLLLSPFRACYQRCRKGHASEILHLPSTLNKPMGGYACQMVFNKKFDIEKLRTITLQLSKDCGIDEKFVRVDLEPKPPHGTWPSAGSGPMRSDHYVGEGSGMFGQENWLKTMDILNMDKGIQLFFFLLWYNSFFFHFCSFNLISNQSLFL